MKKFFVLSSLFILAFLTRTVWHLGPNVELITLVMLLSATYFDGRTSFWLTLTVLVSTDLVLGNTNVLLFTWSGFLLPLFLVTRVLKFKLNRIISGTFTGLGANLFFYAWTNFGVWLLDAWGMYPRNLSGLLASYINGLPFLKNQLVGNLIFIPLGFGIVEIIKNRGEIYDWIRAKYRIFDSSKL